jgi:hypothetical protein
LGNSVVKIWLILLRRLGRGYESAFGDLGDDAKRRPSLVCFIQIVKGMGPASVFTPQWVATVSQRAVTGNSKLISVSNGLLNAGPATEMVLYEAAAHAMASTVSGANLWEAAPARNKYKNRATPLEARLAAEVGHACAHMELTREGANELLLKILAKYEDQIPDAPLGSEFRECYDAAKSVPTPEYLDLYSRVRQDLAAMGLEFPY